MPILALLLRNPIASILGAVAAAALVWGGIEHLTATHRSSEIAALQQAISVSESSVRDCKAALEAQNEAVEALKAKANTYQREAEKAAQAAALKAPEAPKGHSADQIHAWMDRIRHAN
ncbi:MAG: hypothetical protein IRY96_00450 [Burkholderiales bacterium]|nr:hypothetical protein [Burkholderiales bacterium]